ncbi:MAG: hypothetical protein L3J96_05270 [Thermoplasmata archaeon]|nr:hypothetical protein [Thermoplasmata archaeon]
MFGSTTSADLPSPPTPSLSPTASSRYVYLLTRLRNKQITMEEATELFSIQQSMIRSSLRVPPPPPGDAGTSQIPPPPVNPALGLPSADDSLWMTMLAMGAGAGVLAALFKRARDGPISDPSPPEAPTSGAGGRSG